MQWVPDTLLLIAGDGDIRHELLVLSRERKLSERIVFLGKIPPKVLHKITSQCDLGVSLEEDMGLNYRMALPNKIFDYIQARIPVLCSSLPEMQGIVEQYRIGEVIHSRVSRDLAAQLTDILKDGTRRKVWKNNLEKAAKELCWEKEEEKLLGLLDRIERETS